MAFCPNCGTQAEGKFCPKCGSAIGVAPGAPPPGNPPYQAPPPSQPPPPYQAQQPYQGQPQYQQPASAGGMTENVAGALCYLLGLITGILFLVLEPYNKSKFVRFHAFQAIFFHVGFIVFWIVLTIVTFILPFGLRMIVHLLSLIFWLGGVGLWLYAMYQAYNNIRFKIPIIGDIAEKQS